MSEQKIHYAGDLKWKLADGRTCQVRGGYAACCSGELAFTIKRDGNNTREVRDVTCRRCIRVMTNAGVM